jgi:hypothetical protein
VAVKFTNNSALQHDAGHRQAGMQGTLTVK